MVLVKEIELELYEKNRNVPEAIEDTLIKDSVIDLANANFSKIDEVEDVALGEIRKKIIVDTGYSGKAVSRTHFFKGDLQGDAYVKPKVTRGEKVCMKSDSDKNSQESNDKFFENKSGDSNDSLSSDEPSEKSEFSDREYEEEVSVDENIEDVVAEDFRDQIDLAHLYEDKGKSDIDIFSAKSKDSDAEVAKGISVKNQLNVWESLLEGRIKLQTSLISSNKLYQKEDFSNFRSNLKPEDEAVLSNTYNSLGKLMNNLLVLQESLLSSSEEFLDFRDPVEPFGEINKESNKHQLMPSTAKEENDNLSVTNSFDGEPNRKRIKLKNYSDHLEELYSDFRPFKDKIIQTWNDKTRITSGKISSSDFSAFDQPTLKQIEQILLDKSRLIRRTQLKRSDYEILGKQRKNITEDDERTQKEYDPEIFDDDDFYHKLLRELIARKATDATDTKKHGRQWLEIQHLRSKMKRKVDTRSTKGRKLRYTVHNKLMNFMAPISYNIWNEEAETQLFKSLFGKATEQIS